MPLEQPARRGQRVISIDSHSNYNLCTGTVIRDCGEAGVEVEWDSVPFPVLPTVTIHSPAYIDPMTSYGIATNYDEAPEGAALTIWSGPFASQYEGSASLLPSGTGYIVTPYYGEPFTVECLPRDEDTYQHTDNAINTALNVYWAKSRSTAA